MHAQPSEARYTVHLRVTVDGPEADWDALANRLRIRVEKVRMAPFTIAAVAVDQAEDEGEG